MIASMGCSEMISAACGQAPPANWSQGTCSQSRRKSLLRERPGLFQLGGAGLIVGSQCRDARVDVLLCFSLRMSKLLLKGRDLGAHFLLQRLAFGFEPLFCPFEGRF